MSSIFTLNSVVRLRFQHTAMPRGTRRTYAAGTLFRVVAADERFVLARDPKCLTVSIPTSLFELADDPNGGGPGGTPAVAGRIGPRRLAHALVAA